MIARIKNTIMVNGKRKVYPYLASSDNPFHPQGFGQHGESKNYLTGKHLGKRVRFESLHGDVQAFVLDNI